MDKDSLVLYRPTIRTVHTFVKELFPYHVYENCRIGGGNIYYGRSDSGDTIIATYSFDEKSGLPIFDIKDDQRGCGNRESFL